MAHKRKTKVQSIRPVINPHAVGADIVLVKIHLIRVPTELYGSQPVRCFPTFTEDLRTLVPVAAILRDQDAGDGSDQRVLDSPGRAAGRSED